MDSYKETFETWNKIADLYQDRFMDLDLYDDTYNKLCTLIDRPDASVLDVGCGPGNICRYLLSQMPKARVAGIDIAPNMVALAKQNNPGADFEVMDIRNVSTLERQFDAIVCGFCIPYLSKQDCGRLIIDTAGLLVPKGLLYISFVAGDYQRSGFMTGSRGDRAYFYYHDREQVRSDLTGGGFIVEYEADKEYERADGSREQHTIMIARLQHIAK